MMEASHLWLFNVYVTDNILQFSAKVTSKASKMWVKVAKHMIRQLLANLDEDLRRCIIGQMSR
jgi:hypothetical protein